MNERIESLFESTIGGWSEAFTIGKAPTFEGDGPHTFAGLKPLPVSIGFRLVGDQHLHHWLEVTYKQVRACEQPPLGTGPYHFGYDPEHKDTLVPPSQPFHLAIAAHASTVMKPWFEPRSVICENCARAVLVEDRDYEVFR